MTRLRILSKLIDYILFFIGIYFCGFSFLINIILFCLLPFLFAPIEAILHTLIKTTPGKWLCGITIAQNIPFFKSLKLSFKKSLLILPLFFTPLNIFFAWFYLKESEEHSKRRWSNYDGEELIFMESEGKKKNTFLKSALVFMVSLSLTWTVLPNSVKNELISISKQELDLNDWVEVSDQQLNFSVYFPNDPKVENKKLEVEERDTTLEITEYTHSEKKIAYTLQSSDIPSSWTYLGSDYLFKALEKPLEEYQGKIIEKKNLKHGSHPAMAYLLKNNSGGQTQGQMILVKKTIYKLEVTSKKNLTKKEKESANNFINSFEIN
ncbi:MAG: hypothetical protein S4CHLAM20_08360 [Chlamydiia bacterium]|nr:hypothetical protein [Chlamydiia bacterium]